MNKTVYFLLRFGVGTSMLGHGLVRIPKLAVFATGMVHHFEKSILPDALVNIFAYVLPFVELIVGLLLVLGILTRVALIAGSLTMIFLIFGSTTIESWEDIPSQLIHLAFFAVLLQFIEANAYTMDFTSAATETRRTPS